MQLRLFDDDLPAPAPTPAPEPEPEPELDDEEPTAAPGWALRMLDGAEADVLESIIAWLDSRPGLPTPTDRAAAALFDGWALERGYFSLSAELYAYWRWRP